MPTTAELLATIARLELEVAQWKAEALTSRRAELRELSHHVTGAFVRPMSHTLSLES